MATNRKLGRTTDIRMAMLRNLTTDLLVYGKVETTLPRAKEVKSIVDSLISLAIKEKDNFEQSFTRYADYSSSQNLVSVQEGLIQEISEGLIDDIFNKAVVNW